MAKINLQQVPKDKEVLSTFVADPGHVLVHSDVNALEPRVLAAFSRDPTYIKLYASGETHDAYGYVASRSEPNLELRAQYSAAYALDPFALKKQWPEARDLWKEFHLSGMYGAGAERMYNGMIVKGHKVTIEQVQSMREHYWQDFSVVKDFEASLKAERKERGGWILNGRGRALAITSDKERDILNTFCQSTGHDLLVTWLWYLRKIRDERSIPMRPWIVDVHDASIWQVPEEYKEQAGQAFLDAYDRLNEELQSDVPMAGDVEYGYSFADFKD